MSASLLIKGYLPVRIKIPSSSGETDETFCFVKEHRTGDSGSQKKGSTLFVANAPVVPNIRTKLLIKSLFGRFGEVSRVTVVPNPHIQNSPDDDGDDNTDTLWTERFPMPSFLPPRTSEGKFAHVVFASSKEMKRVLRALSNNMLEAVDDDEEDPIARLPGLVLDKIEMQTLADESDRQYREEIGLNDDDTCADGHNSTGVRAVAERYRMSLQRLARDSLLEECNTVIHAFENAEAKDKREREAAANKPDDDGFVTVTYTSQVGSKRDLEETETGQRRKKGQKRSRRKKNDGAAAQDNFYRFQTKEKRKQSLQDLRRQFEDDLQKVKQMKEDRKYRPF